MPTISIEDDAPPIVRILGVTLRRAAGQPALARRMDSMRGRVALRSTVDPQAATIHFDTGKIAISHGVHPKADVIISADLNTMGQPGAPKPKVSGALSHLRLALGVSKVLDPPVPGGWQGAAEELWQWSSGRRGRPDRLVVHCTDDGSERAFGEPGSKECEIRGPAWALQAVFTGGDHLGAAMIEGRIQLVGTFETNSELIGVTSAYMFGDD